MNYFKERNMITVVLLYIFTFGVYPLYLFFVFSNEVSKAAIYEGVRTQPRTPLVAFLLSLITFGIYGIVYQYFIAKSLQEIGRKHNYETMDPTLVVILTIFFGIGVLVNVYSASEISKMDNLQTNVSF